LDIAKGHFYLGTALDSGKPHAYDSKNLTTHGVIVGMTGSGKTGLGFNFLEEALRSGVSTSGCREADPAPQSEDSTNALIRSRSDTTPSS
jgi:N-acetylmuramic acid 6-phosphate (MurNAc-6-P) etherase